jgi:putative transposase
MKKKVRPSELKSKLIERLLTQEEFTGLESLLLRSAEQILQQALEEELSDHLERDWYERSKEPEKCSGYRNGYYPRKIRTTEGKMSLDVPRVRNTDQPFSSKLLSRIDDIERNIKSLAVELYVRGLSTRDIEESLVDENGKSLLSRNAVSHLTETLYEEYEQFIQRDLSHLDIVYLFVDGVYESVRRYTRNQAILCGWGICSDGRKVLLHLSAVRVESEDSWSSFFEEMLSRGLRQPLLVISDGDKGLIKAIAGSFPRAKRQRCIAHKMRNLMNKVPKEIQSEIKTQVHDVYYACDRQSAEVLSSKFIDKYVDKYPALIRCFTEDLDSCLTQLEFPIGHRRIIRTTNLIERAFVEEKRRTKIIPQHQHEKGAMKLVFGVLIRASYHWQRINISELDLTILKNIRKTMGIKNKIEQNEEKISYIVAA